MGLVSLDTVSPDTQVSLDTTPVPVAEDVAKSRAAKGEFSLGGVTGKTYDDIYKDITNGQEDTFRADAASKMDYQDMVNRQKALSELAAKRGSNVSLKEFNDIVNGKPTNPDTVLEKAYAERSVQSLREASSRMESDILKSADLDDPEKVEAYLNRGSTLSWRLQYAAKKAQDLESEVQNDAYFHIPFPEAFGGPIAIGSKTAPISSVINWATLGAYGGLRQEYLMRGNTPETGMFTGGLEANNVRAQALELLHQPTDDDFKNLFDRAFERLRAQDPTLAQQWASSIAGMSTNEMITRDFMSGANLLGAAGLFATAKSILRGVGNKQVQTAGRKPITPVNPVEDNIQQAQKAVEDVLKSTPASPTKANIAEATGDTKEAAVQKAIVSVENNNPAQDAIDTLMDIHRVNQQAIKKNPGNNSREEHTRILDAGETFAKDLVDTVQNTTKLVRLPALAEEGFRSIADQARDFFRGRDNTVVNVDMGHDSFTNTDHHVVTVGNYDGRPFSSAKQAENHARINGMGEAKVVGQDPDVVYLPPTAVLDQEHVSTYRTKEGPLPDDIRFITPQQKDTFDRRVAQGKITGHREQGDEFHLITDHEAGSYIKTTKEPQDFSAVPVDKTGKFHPEILSEESKVRTVPRSNFVHEVDKNGRFSFWLDHPDGFRAEVLPSVNPEPTYIPFNTKTGKFGEPLSYGPHVQQNGLGFHLKWYIPLNEQQDIIRERLLNKRTESSSTNHSFINDSFLGYFRLPQDTLSMAENENRAKLVWSENRLLALAKGQMQFVENLYHGLLKDAKAGKYVDAVAGNLTGRNKQMWEDFKTALVAAQKWPDPKTGLPGYYFQTPAEINHFWLTKFNRPASFAEQQAYLAVGRMHYADWVFRNIAVYKNMSRLGVMEHEVSWLPAGSPDGKKVSMPSFKGRLLPATEKDGKLRSPIPEGDIPTVIIEKDGSTSFYNAKNTNDKKQYREAARNGDYKVIQLYNPDQFDIKVWDKNKNPVRVVYAVVHKSVLTSKPLAYDQVGWRGGGHWDYNYDRFISQPVVRKYEVGGRTHYVYEGDATFAPIKHHADAEIITKKLNEIRQLLKDKKVDEAKKLHQSFFDQEWKDFVKNFYPKKNRQTGEIEPSRFSLDDDFQVRPKGFTIAQYDKKLINKYEKITGSKFVNAANGENSLARNFQVEFTGARDSHDLFEPIQKGTLQNPMYSFQPAELTDPVVSMTRALKRIISSQAGDDYKYSAVEHWLAENMDKLNGRPEENWATPFSTFLNGTLNRRYLLSMEGQAAESNRYKIKKLIGMPTYADAEIHRWKQTLADAIYSTDSKTKKALLIPPSWTLQHINSPTNFVRGMAFHENLGFWNWTQLAAQNMGYINFAALSPDHALAGMFGAWMHQWSHINNKPAILKYLGRMTEKALSPWKPGEWEEARRIYNTTGFADRFGKIAIYNPEYKFLASAASNAVSKGTIFFDLAEQNVRHGAWYTAFHEYKRAFPNKKIDDVEVGKILRRANDLYMNMGRDSKTLLNTGLTSMTLQFYKYIENVGQMFFSRRIGDVFGQENTWQLRARQRAQMIAMYSLMFGPAGATGLSLLPINDWIRKYAIGEGYVPGEKSLSTLLMEGPFAYAGAFLSGWWRTGKWDAEKGTFYNFNNRYGANGWQIFRDILEPSPSMWKILLGAGGSTLANNLASFSPFVYAMKSSWNEEKDAPFQLTLNHWKSGIENINSMRYADRLIYALEFGKWLDRHGRPTDDISIGTIDAIFRTLLGVSDQRYDDQYLKTLIQQQEKADFSQAEKDYQYHRRLAEQAAMNNDPQQAIIENNNAIFVLKSKGVPDEEVAKIMAADANLNKGTIQKTNDSFYQKFVPTYRKPAADKAYQEIYRQEH